MHEWLENIGEGVPGYVTPKIAIGAIVGNDDGGTILVVLPVAECGNFCVFDLYSGVRLE